jgi:RNA recognition motif-containing protein
MYKVFVGGLPFATTDDELRELFAAHGKVASANVVRDRESGRSKGFGFVEFENDEEGKAAEKALTAQRLVAGLSPSPKPVLKKTARAKTAGNSSVRTKKLPVSGSFLFVVLITPSGHALEDGQQIISLISQGVFYPRRNFGKRFFGYKFAVFHFVQPLR